MVRHHFQPSSDGEMLRTHFLALAALDTIAGLSELLRQVAVQHELCSPRLAGKLLHFRIVEGKILGNPNVHRTEE